MKKEPISKRKEVFKIMGAAGNKKNKPKNKHVPSYQIEESSQTKEPQRKHEFAK